jgi:hypothetical protein
VRRTSRGMLVMEGGPIFFEIHFHIKSYEIPSMLLLSILYCILRHLFSSQASLALS